MDLNAYFLNELIETTAQTNETAAAARSRADAIGEMLRAYDPRDGMESMIACQCVMLQFMLKGAMRDANKTTGEPELAAKARAGAISASRTLHQWVTKFENARKRNETVDAEAAKTRAATQPPAQPSPDPERTPPVIRTPAPNGRAGAETIPPDHLLAAAAAVRAAASGQGFSDPREPRVTPRLQAEASRSG